MTFTLVLGILAAVALTIVLCIKVLPVKKDGTFSKKPLQLLHDYFNFKKLYLEFILKIIFTFASIASAICGVLAATVGNLFNCIGYVIEYSDSRWFDFSDVFELGFGNLLGGLAIAVLGPLALRLAYEIVMMFILLVKNVIEINDKMKKEEVIEEKSVEE